jgi:CheY-like chemotaxis protein
MLDLARRISFFAAVASGVPVAGVVACSGALTSSARRARFGRVSARVLASARGMAEPEQERIFVVDRDPHVRKLLQRFLGDAYAFEFFDDGYAALDRARRFPPSALITEIVTPLLDGLALCRLLKGDHVTQHVPILVLSMMASGERARQSGANDFLEKPLEKRRLVASVHDLIESRGRGSRLPPQEQSAS